ncbi:MAG: hemolysin activation protein, partial [Prevotellaceae bacterium]|nr:hemolysin activation protein [Prevotellaceae bacterium]
LITNLGAVGEATHYTAANATLPRAQRRLVGMTAHELDFPLRHPTRMVEDVAYRRRLYRTMGWGHPLLKASRSVEELLLNLRAGNFGRIRRAAAARLAILLRGRRWD